jgi:hypothetical protein
MRLYKHSRNDETIMARLEQYDQMKDISVILLPERKCSAVSSEYRLY